MTTHRLALRGLGILLALLAAGPAPAADTVERILAHVNSRIVTQSQYNARWEQAVKEQGPPPNAARAEELKKMVFATLINEALLEDRARDLDLITNDKEIEDQIRRLKEENKISSDAEFEKALESQGLTLDKLRDQLRNAGTVQRVVGREVQSKVDTSEDALRIIYEREKESYRIPEKARLAEILISRGDDPAAAQLRVQGAVDKLKGGAKFEDVVKEYSDGATKGRGGDLGWVSRGELVAEIDKTVFALPVNTVSDPITTKFGWHLVKVLEKAPVSYRPFSEVKAEILKREQETQFQKKLAEYLEKLKRDAVIRVAPEVVAYYTPPTLPPEAQGMALASAAPGATPFDVPALTPGRDRKDLGIEITPTVGYRFGGTASEAGSAAIDRIKIPASLSFGLTAEYRLTDALNVELLWSHQDTEMKADFSDVAAAYENRVSHLNLDTIQIGVLWQSGASYAKARLYADLLLGATILTPSPEFSVHTRFSASIGGGIKYYFSDRLGARLGARWMPVYINSTSAGYGYCSPYYGCYTYWNTNYLSQGDAYTGFILSF
ncbi:MAG TPA: peptidylprolyl isomerase [Thermoanaerobaculia bacterium]|nr:peptidylprolyl isomerase [Thermoanaerobaculia bacterium]HQR68336.1 peptidylprolyl isomerase [Thermoanaerobaculia bacterium]